MKSNNHLLLLPLLAFCVFSAPLLSAQKTTYRTIKVKGKVTLAAARKPLRKDQKFNANDALVFGSATDFVIAIDDKTAAFLLQPDAPLRTYRVKPLNLTVNTKPGYILTDLQLRQFLNENDSLLLLDGRFSLLLGKDAFPMDEKHFFYLQYLWKGDTINKRLGHRGDTLVIDEKELYKVDGKPIDPTEVSNTCFLRYFDAATQESIAYPDMVQPIYIINTPEADLKTEIGILMDATKGQEEHSRMLQIDNYLVRFYGKAGEWELVRWFKALDK